jgi:hypothetical protein
MAKTIIKKTISDPQLKKELFKLFNKGNTSNSNIYELLRTKYKLMKQRYIKMYHASISEWQKTQEKAQIEQTIENTKESLKSGLKSKIERQLELQAMLEPDYRVEEIVGTDVKSGKVIRAMRVLNPMERRNIHAELSKMDGSYAPAKIDAEIRDLRPLFGDVDELLKE